MIEKDILNKIEFAGMTNRIRSVQKQIERISSNKEFSNFFEGIHTRLSLQEVVDCAQSSSHRTPISKDAFSFIRKFGVSLNSYYPVGYIGRPCLVRKLMQPLETISNYRLLQPGDEENLKAAVAVIGPISVSIMVTNNFLFYQRGVFYDPECNDSLEMANHAMLLVGYGSDPRLGDFWVVQNNWGSHWGERGFARISRNSLNNCGIAVAAFYPVVEDSMHQLFNL